MTPTLQLNFDLSRFRQYELPDLLINIWSYSSCVHKDCSICEHYKKLCIVAAREKRSGFYHNFDEVIEAIERNEWYHNLGKISSEQKNIIYKYITKRCFGGCFSDVVKTF